MLHRRRQLLGWALLALALAGWVVLVRSLVASPRDRFLSRDFAYFESLGRDCGQLLRQWPPAGTNRFTTLPGQDPGLPQLIRGLQADEIHVYQERVWIGFDLGRESFAILWEPNPLRTNSWVLLTDYDGKMEPVYSPAH